MPKGTKLTVKAVKHICDLIGKKGADGKPITAKEIKTWPSMQGKKK